MVLEMKTIRENIASLLDKIKYLFSVEPDLFDDKIHKSCEDCNGGGIDDLGACDSCEGKGYVKKTYQEVHNISPYKSSI